MTGCLGVFVERDVGRECHREYVTLATEGGIASLESKSVILHSLSCYSREVTITDAQSSLKTSRIKKFGWKWNCELLYSSQNGGNIL